MTPFNAGDRYAQPVSNACFYSVAPRRRWRPNPVRAASTCATLAILRVRVPWASPRLAINVTSRRISSIDGVALVSDGSVNPNCSHRTFGFCFPRLFRVLFPWALIGIFMLISFFRQTVHIGNELIKLLMSGPVHRTTDSYKTAPRALNRRSSEHQRQTQTLRRKKCYKQKVSSYDMAPYQVHDTGVKRGFLFKAEPAVDSNTKSIYVLDSGFNVMVVLTVIRAGF